MANLFISLAVITIAVVGDGIFTVSLAKTKTQLPNGPLINVTKHLSFPNFNPDNPRIYHDVNLLGSAIFSRGCIQIPDTSQKKKTTDLRHQAGRALHSYPIRLFDPQTKTPASFHTTFSFQIKSTNSSSGGGNGGGSGLSFIIVPDEFTVGRPGPWLGMLNDACDEEYKAIGIEFDTRKNPEFGDPNDNHIGINLASIVSSTTVDASEVGVNLKDGSVHRAWVSYEGPGRVLEIRLGQDNSSFPAKPAFSGPIDLAPFMREYMFVGFSASTGNFSQIHNIISWNFTSRSQGNLRIPTAEACESKLLNQMVHRKTPTSFMVFVSVVVLVIVVLINLCINGNRKETSRSTVDALQEKNHRPRPPNKPRRFTVAEIEAATRGFNESQELGRDLRGVTYKGTVSSGSPVAVKRFTTQFLNSPGLDRRRLAKEIQAISKIRHPNLVPVRGWCVENREAAVVYDYLPNGSLDKWLFGVGVLPWTRRFKVVRDVAESLSYLHSKLLAHKNVKTSSVFLDVSFRAVLGDFGFVLNSAESKQFESAVSQKADVFGFGIFVLEVVGGRRRMKRSDPGEMDLLDLAWAKHETGEKAKVVDRRMGSALSIEQVIRVMDVGLLCTLNENKGRPTMEDVVEYLNSERPVPELPLCRPVSLYPYSSTTGLCTGYACTPFK